MNLAFGLTRLYEHDFFEQLQHLVVDKNMPNIAQLRHLQQLLYRKADAWNEDELKFFFISPFLALVDYQSSYYNAFTQRPMEVVYDNNTKITAGRVKFMLARGIQIPQLPYFFLHEYKPEKRRENDPLGQLLIAMVAAQYQNADGLPIYGVYVISRFWYFVILDKQQYAVSQSYDAANPDTVLHLFAILQYIKSLMEQLYGVVNK